MNKYRFRLAISAEEYLAYYAGTARNVVVTLANGQRLQFPADALRTVVSHGGVFGEYVLRVDAQNKLQTLERVGD